MVERNPPLHPDVFPEPEKPGFKPEPPKVDPPRGGFIPAISGPSKPGDPIKPGPKIEVKPWNIPSLRAWIEEDIRPETPSSETFTTCSRRSS